MYELLEALVTETLLFEEQNRFIQGMTEKIKEGIETARQGLDKEKEKRLYEEVGLVHH